MVVSILVVLLSGIVWGGAHTHFRGCVEATRALWAKQAGVRHTTPALQTSTKAYFRTAWLVTAAVAVSGTVGKCGFQRSSW